MPLYLYAGGIVVVDGALAISEDCCCVIDVYCDCEDPPTGFTVSAGGLGTITGDTEFSTEGDPEEPVVTCLLSGCGLILDEATEVAEIYADDEFCWDGALWGDWPGFPKYEDGPNINWPMPFEGTWLPSCDEGGTYAEWLFFRQRERRYSKCYIAKGVCVNFTTDTEIDMGIQYFRVNLTIEYKLCGITNDANSEDTQYRRMRNDYIYDECWSDAPATFFSVLGAWEPIADEVSLTSLDYVTPEWNTGGCLSLEGRNLVRVSCDPPCGFYRYAGDCIVYEKYHLPTSIEEGCFDEFDLGPGCVLAITTDWLFNLTLEEIEANPYALFIKYGNYAIGHFSNWHPDTLDVCGITLDEDLLDQIPIELPYTPQALVQIYELDFDDDRLTEDEEVVNRSEITYTMNYTGRQPCALYRISPITLDREHPYWSSNNDGSTWVESVDFVFTRFKSSTECASDLPTEPVSEIVNVVLIPAPATITISFT